MSGNSHDLSLRQLYPARLADNHTLSMRPKMYKYGTNGFDSAKASQPPSPPVYKDQFSLTLFAAEPAPGSGAILIDANVDYSKAEELCNQLGESLWDTDELNSTNPLKFSLDYQVFLGNYKKDAEFWVGVQKEKDCKCRAMQANGSLHHAKCSERLPVLCSQSASVSNITWEDNSKPLQVTRDLGVARITGYRDFYTWRFRGIRYAPEPQRFEYSTTLRNMTGEISALEPGADCLQADAPDLQDDCLFLNVWTPSLPAMSNGSVVAPTKLKPVVFNIYGGSLMTGSGSNPALDMGNIASRGDVVAVSFNHRMGNLGLLVFNDGIHNGNIALNDQISALTWVKENIATFGGDPDRITISGESSGAISVRYLLSSPLAKGLYSGAYQQSDGNGGPAEPWGLWWSKKQSYEYFTKTVLREFGCDDADDEVECLRQVPGERLTSLDNLDGERGTARYPVVDNHYLTTPHFLLDGSGPRYARDIPLVTGSTRDEGGITAELAALPWDSMGLEDWKNILIQSADRLRVDLDPVFANLDVFGLTANSTGDDLFKATAKIVGNSMFICLDRAKAYSASKNKVVEKVYSFTVNRTYSLRGYTTKWCDAPITPQRPNGDPNMEYLKCHGGAQMPTFGTYKRLGYPDRDGFDVPFSRLLIDYFTSFVRTGDPNPDESYLKTRGYDSTVEQVRKIGKWRPVNPETPEEMILQWDGAMAPFADGKLCSILGQPLEYWEDIEGAA
ncbi:hypothetical protein NLU13_6722 [Sarocladium strictum]|uniref:Carboxylesterase type B domain-containing protein n=1 Tax=Sarocladium strictum TaxID=5046 RepID=A0AA39GG91_SARSR|nr:hypothetical protein NLU13_6722 [Sarocladium strictum]